MLKKIAMEFKKKEIEKIFKEFVDAFNKGPESVVSFFAEDAKIQYPYSDYPPMNRQEYFDQLSEILPIMAPFTQYGFKLYATDEQGTYWATMDLECNIQTTGKVYGQHYVIRFSINIDMKITHYYEYWNPLKFIEATKL